MSMDSQFDGFAYVEIGPKGETERPCDCTGGYGPTPEGISEPGESFRGIGIVESAYDEATRLGIDPEVYLEG